MRTPELGGALRRNGRCEGREGGAGGLHDASASSKLDDASTSTKCLLHFEAMRLMNLDKTILVVNSH